MSFTQLVSVIVFLIYSVAYLLFVGWASSRTSQKKARLKPATGILLLAVGIGGPLAGLCFLLQAGQGH